MRLVLRAAGEAQPNSVDQLIGQARVIEDAQSLILRDDGLRL